MVVGGVVVDDDDEDADDGSTQNDNQTNQEIIKYDRVIAFWFSSK